MWSCPNVFPFFGFQPQLASNPADPPRREEEPTGMESEGFINLMVSRNLARPLGTVSFRWGKRVDAAAVRLIGLFLIPRDLSSQM